MATIVEFQVEQDVPGGKEALRVRLSVDALEDGWMTTLTLGTQPAVRMMLPKLEAMCQTILDELLLAKKRD